jgi:ubiquinone/menaquinone biosynthesis C-methylase UbiE
MVNKDSQDCSYREEKGSQTCGLFDFMANEVGIKVLHPGGYKSTKELCSMCDLNESSYVLDLACGVGTTAFFISDRYGCRIAGIDISEDLIAIANKDLGKRGDEGNIRFEVADALEIPFPDNTFDAVISQAFFILIDEKEEALEEISRVLKPGGYFGSLELSWFKAPPERVYEELVDKTCNDLIPRVVTFDEWDSFFRSKNLAHVATLEYPMESGMLQLLVSEGVANSLRIMSTILGNSQTRTRMMTVKKTFRKHSDYLGYGLFCYRKQSKRG